MTDLLADERHARVVRLLPLHMGDAAPALIALAAHAATIYAERGSVFVSLEPGDATRYPLLLTDLARVAGLGGKGQQLAPAAGGELAVQLFDHPLDVRTPLALGLPAYLLPQDVVEHLGVTNGHTACVLAAFLTAFSDALDEVRRG